MAFPTTIVLPMGQELRKKTVNQFVKTPASCLFDFVSITFTIKNARVCIPEYREHARAFFCLMGCHIIVVFLS